MSTMPLLLKNLTADRVHAALASAGVTARLARQLQTAALRRGVLPDRLHGVSPRLLAEVRSLTTIPHLRAVGRVVSPLDGFAKYLFLGDGPDPFEAVRRVLARLEHELCAFPCCTGKTTRSISCA